jgi:hypothetical protein
MYQSPIEIIYGEITSSMENDIIKVVQKYGINVDKEELLRALRYDRDQYNKGYADALNLFRKPLIASTCDTCAHQPVCSKYIACGEVSRCEHYMKEDLNEIY